MPSVGICVYEHTCLPELWFCNFLWVEAPRPVPTVPEFVWPLQLAVTLGGGRAISVPEIWNFAHISTGQLFLLQRPHPHLLYQSLLLSPKHYLFSLCLRQYDCQHVRWFLKA